MDVYACFLCVLYFWDERLLSESQVCCIDTILTQFVILAVVFMFVALTMPIACFTVPAAQRSLLTGVGHTLWLMYDI